MKRTFWLILLVILSAYVFAEEKPILRIGVVYDGVTDENVVMGELLEKEFNNILGSEYKIVFPKEKQLVDDFEINNIRNHLNSLLEDKEVDVIVAGGILSSYAALSGGELSKPVFAPLVFQDITLPVKKKNFNYISSDIELEKEVENFKRIARFTSAKILIGKDIIDGIDNIVIDAQKYFESQKIGVDFEIVPVGDNVLEVISQLEGAEAIYIGPIRKFSEDRRKAIYDYINEKKIPSFSIRGFVDIKEGILAGYSYERNIKKSIRAIGLNLSEYLDGTKMEELPVTVGASDPELLLNMEVVQKTGIWPNWDIIAEAKLVNFSEADAEGGMDLKEIVEIATNNNPDIQAMKRTVEQARIDIETAKSNYKPSIDLNATAALLDEDRAESMTSPAEKTLSAGATVTQLIYSDDANLNIDIKRETYDIQKEELKRMELDLTLEAGTAYMNVLKAKAYSKIQQNNLELTKTNLEIAKSRKKAGISGPADIYRWEAELANSISGLMEAMMGVQIAEKNLLRIMNLDLNEELSLIDVDHTNGAFVTSHEVLKSYIENQKNIDILIEYLSQMAFENSPELKALGNVKDIQERLYENKRKKRYMPTIAMQASYTRNNIIKEGAGSDDLSLPNFGNISDPATQSTLGGILGGFGDPDDNDWSIGVKLSIPIYSGGSLKHEKEVVKNEIRKIEYQDESARKRMEQGVATYVIKLASDFAKIQNANKSSISAHKALDLVKDAYLRGVVSMSELIETQTAAISADEYRTTVIYDFLISTMNTERMVGQFFINYSAAEKAGFINDIVKFRESKIGE